ncbi:telomeric repeat-binding factor 2 [Patella vulgata]|uniref:telomeric repeat-binding factor 2 n=1 Tax=Patella vulgata TaxID=6465 RepID=UPI00217FDCD4|nr:telomeric repeat-binding factor 2 [Patella vulgata]
MAGSSSTEKHLNSWIIEYACHAAWKEFSTTMVVESIRDFVQGTISLPHARTSKLLSDIYFLVLICRLSDGEDYQTSYEKSTDSSETKTVLESVLQFFDKYLAPYLEGTSGPENIKAVKQASRYRSLIKAQSVITCGRADDFDTAQLVYDRQYSNIHTSHDKDWSSRLKTLLRSRNKNHRLIKENSYSKFLEIMVEYLKPLVEMRERPYLLKVEDSYCDMVTKMKSTETRIIQASSLARNGAIQDKAVTSTQIKLAQQKRREETVRDIERDNSNNNHVHTTQNSAASPSKRNHTSPQKSSHSSPPMSPPKSPQQSPSKSPHRPIEERIAEREAQKRAHTKSIKKNDFVYRKNENRENRHQVFSSDSVSDLGDSSDEEIPSKIPHRNLKSPQSRNSLAPPRDGIYRNRNSVSYVSSTAKRSKWTHAESFQLFKAVKEVGVGRWAQCKEIINTTRSSVNLKDRWRTMVKSKLVETFVKDYGPIG